MGEKIHIGIIGCGWIAQLKHIPNYANSPYARIMALCDHDIDKVKDCTERFNLQGVKWHRDYREMLRAPNIDAVIVATPNLLHREMTVAALEAGKHVLCEKPMATTAADAEAMVAAARKSGKILTVGFQWRFRPECLYIKRICEEGLLGDIYFAKAHGLRRRGVPTWGKYLDPAINGGGTLWDGAPHPLDLTLWAMDNYEPHSVMGNIHRKMFDKPEGNPWGAWDPADFKVEDDNAFALITMKNGATIFLETAWVINVAESNDMKTTLCGTKAGVDMFDEGGCRINTVLSGRTSILRPDVKPSFVPGAVPTPIAPVYEGQVFIDAIRNKTEPVVKPEQACVVTRIIEGIYQSARSGKPVYF